jgi:hypothetical protein
MSYVDATRELRSADGFWRHTTCGFEYNPTTGNYFTSEAYFYGNRNPDEWIAVGLRARGPSVEQATISEFGALGEKSEGNLNLCPIIVEELPPG